MAAGGCNAASIGEVGKIVYKLVLDVIGRYSRIYSSSSSTVKIRGVAKKF